MEQPHHRRELHVGIAFAVVLAGGGIAHGDGLVLHEYADLPHQLIGVLSANGQLSPAFREQLLSLLSPNQGGQTTSLTELPRWYLVQLMSLR